MPQILPRNAEARVGAICNWPVKTRYPENVISVSSGIGNPMMPNINRKKMPAYPYWQMQWASVCSKLLPLPCLGEPYSPQHGPYPADSTPLMGAEIRPTNRPLPPPQPIFQPSKTLLSLVVAHRDAQRFLAPYHDHEFLAPRDRHVQEILLQQDIVLGQEGNHRARVFGALSLVKVG